MSGLVAQAAKVAHSTAVNLLSRSQIKEGDKIPEILLKDNPETATVKVHDVPGKILIVGVPGAFTPPCSSQIPGYIENYQKFVDKGFGGIYVVGVNDAFVMNAWKEKLAPQGTPIHFVADDQAQFVSALGLVMDATGLLGGPRSKRFVILAQDGKAVRVKVEDEAPNVTCTKADSVLEDI
ncbi:hypothetical protein FS837_012045 [Tulasnella sp. UAMH 9824]|nr:hypothetical protein FS837_012045 [Tulasnella sp. UAMH 9824]